MKVPLYLLLLSVLLLSACAHLDNGFMRSAEPLEKGEIRGSFGISSSYSYAPGLDFEPEHILVLNNRIRGSEYVCQAPVGLDIGLGKRFQMGGQVSLSGGGKKNNDIFPLTNSFRGYLQYSIPLGDSDRFGLSHSYWLGIAPGILFHNETWPIGGEFGIPCSHRHLLEHHDIGGEIPLTLTQTHHFKTESLKDRKNSNSLTFRYSLIKVNSTISRSPSMFGSIYEYDQPDQSISRYAIIYTRQLENNWNRIFFDLGLEFSNKKGLTVPIFGVKTIFGPPWKAKMKQKPEEA